MLASEELFLKHSIKFEQAMKSYRSKRVNFKQGCLAGIDHTKNMISIKVPNQVSTEESDKSDDLSIETVSYDVLVIATGASYPSPWRS